MRRSTVFALGLCVAGAWGQTLPVEIKVANETIPPGGTVQLKVLLTEPRPIMTGTKSFDMDEGTFDGFYGISLNSPGGDTFGWPATTAAGFPFATFRRWGRSERSPTIRSLRWRRACAQRPCAVRDH